MAGSAEQSQWLELGAAWNHVIEFVSAIAVYGVLGWFADKWLGTGHVLFVLGLVGGNVLGLYILLKRSAQVDRRLEAERVARRAAD